MRTAADLHEWLSFEDPGEDRTWVFDLTFLLSRWTCIYGQGCLGVRAEATPERVEGCCSFAAHFSDDADRARVEAAVATLGPERWQHAAAGARKGVSVRQSDGSWRLRVHEGACIMLNRPGFGIGPGCALHQAALERGQPPLDLKPDVCWQLPLRRVDHTDEVGHVTSTVREWRRRDWGEGGSDFCWWCTESPQAFVGAEPVLATMADELVALAGRPVYDTLVDAVAQRCARSTPLPHPAIRRR